MSWQARVFSFILRHTFKPRLAAASDVAAARAVLNSGRFRTPKDVRVSAATLGGVAGEWIESGSTKGANGTTLLYLHGGGYFACSPRLYRAVTCFFAQQGFHVFAPDYRLAPEHPFPAAIDDAEAAYAALVADGIDPRKIVVAGDSAGGGLSLSLLLRLRKHGRPMPAAAALFSPLTDLAASGPSIEDNDAHCAMFHGEWIATGAKFYLNGADPRTPLASPLYADLRGLPPLLIHVATNEVLLDDSTRLAERAKDARLPVDLRLWPDVPHAWQLFHEIIPEGRESLMQASRFLHGHAQGTAPRKPELDVLIVGTGFSGLGMAIKLKQAGNDSFAILEKAREIGGTWRENTYPGCACDVPSHVYSFSWERKPDWSRMFATQPEILDYLKHCVAKYSLAPHIRFGTEMREAVYDEANDLWEVRTADGKVLTARVLVTAMGVLSRPALPVLPGLERFRGVSFHSAEWRHDVDLTGKRVAVIGTGASAVQFVPQIAPMVAQLTLFQRTPAWVLPKLDRPIGGLEHALYRHVPGASRLLRHALYWRQEMLGLAFIHPKLMAKAKKMALAHMARQVPDPKLRAKLTPDYTIGCKRILISNDYFPSLSRPNVELVTGGIAQVREHSILDKDGNEHPVDAIIFGTGFRVTDLLTPVRIIGRNGVDLNDAWRTGAQAYLGVMSAGFPNLFMLLGPNTGLGHNSVVFMAEQQIRYIMACLRLMRAQRKTSIEVQADVQRRFNDELQHRLKTTVWATGCRSWYLDERGKNVTLWPGFTFEYWNRMRKVKAAHYRLA
ncbi:MAG TPA: alpha/beta hydrolase fold domain-containing protein [Noviherbaspirillum sp.]|nr:alpha/beta hydrolase fold domain-containing protein [Noviherbaspirillum sp.]